MSQGQSREWELTCPLVSDEIEKLAAGDLVYLSGPVYTARDGVYQHMLFDGNEPPIDLRGLTNVSLQSSPAGVEVSPGEFEVASLQATAGFRYAQYMPQLLEQFGVKAVVGKAGMSEQVYQEVFRKHGAVCLTTLGYGLGAIYGRAIKKVLGVYWVKELGISEALWTFEVDRLGPLLVEGDVHGNSFFTQVNDDINRQLSALYDGLKAPVYGRIGEEQKPETELF
ncbi:MAG: fumarate hydratase C-terminal domain-containing protein [Chloroflexota bacterium]|nr:fumarate hydratase C-terminal domain-containing protein [Chloroflexota bacterium]